MKRRFADWLRKKADRLDPDGAPRRTHWSFTFEEGLGEVFNTSDKGCSLWYYGKSDYERAHNEPLGLNTAPEFVTLGIRDESGVTVLGSAEVTKVETSRKMDGYDEVEVPARQHAMQNPHLVTARIPRWVITLKCEMHSFVQFSSTDYPSALKGMFNRGGIRG